MSTSTETWRDEPRGEAGDAAAGTRDWPLEVFGKLEENDIRQVAYVPDSGHSRLIDLCRESPDMITIPLTTEEEGIGVLAGAWLGGERGVLLMQSSGVGNCINTFSLATICRFPLLMAITMRGDWGEVNPWQIPMGQTAREAMSLAGVLVRTADTPADAAGVVESAARIAFSGGFATAAVFSQRMIGTKLFKD